MEMLRRMFIYGKKNTVGPDGWHDNPNLPWYDENREYGDEITGAINNGYTLEEVSRFFENVKELASYAFNKSHSFCYGYISVLMAWLKTYYPIEFMASVLSAQEEDKKKAFYVKSCENMGIKILCPDINKSGKDFTPDSVNKEILYGINAIKGIGGSKLDTILDNRPYNNLEDMINKLPKKIFNKTVGQNLIKAGAFDFLDNNRYNLLNKLYQLRKDKEDILDISKYDMLKCIEFEQDTIGTSVTYKPWWDTIDDGGYITEECIVKQIVNYKDKKGKDMQFATIECNNCTFESILFSYLLSKQGCLIEGNRYILQGRKENDKLLIQKIIKN